MSKWTRVGENLVRHPAGMIYLRARLTRGALPMRISLETDDVRIAKLRRGPMLEELRSQAEAKGNSTRAGKFQTLGELLTDAVERHGRVTGNKASTGRYNDIIAKSVRGLLPIDIAPKEWTAQDARRWWQEVAEKFFWVHANARLRLVRRMMATALEAGLIRTDPTAGLQRVRGVKEVKVLPSQEDFQAVVKEMRDSVRTPKVSRLFVEFMAASGLRPAELRAVERCDVIVKDGKRVWLHVRGGETGTKNRRERMVPISPRLDKVLEEALELTEKGKLFLISDPRWAFRAACERAGVKMMRIYDLRHLFATWAIEQGVDIPTVAKWLGHQDGGALLMKTYAHVRDDHGLAKAALLR